MGLMIKRMQEYLSKRIDTLKREIKGFSIENKELIRSTKDQQRECEQALEVLNGGTSIFEKEVLNEKC